MAKFDEVDYEPHDESTFDRWIELGALDQDDQRVLEHSPLRRFEIKLKSSSDEAERMLHEPLQELLDHKIPGVQGESRVESHVHRHERGMRRRIIRVIASVDQGSGDVVLNYDKETW